MNTTSSPFTCEFRLGKIELLRDLNTAQCAELESIILPSRRIHRDQRLLCAGDQLNSLFIIRHGLFITRLFSPTGREQVTGFYSTGEWLGLDALHCESSPCEVIALEDGVVCELPLAQLSELASRHPALHVFLFKAMSRQIASHHAQMLVLGKMSAEERLADFLLSASRYYARLGYSANSFHLRMTREAMGSYLGLKLETVSRTLGKFQDLGLIRVHYRLIELLNDDTLRKLANGEIADAMSPTATRRIPQRSRHSARITAAKAV